MVKRVCLILVLHRYSIFRASEMVQLVVFPAVFGAVPLWSQSREGQREEEWEMEQIGCAIWGICHGAMKVTYVQSVVSPAAVGAVALWN